MGPGATIQRQARQDLDEAEQMTIQKMQASFMFGQESMANSVASDLTEKIREFMKQKDGSFDDIHEEGQESQQTANAKTSFLGEQYEVFPQHFHRKTMSDRNEQIEANLHAAHLREEFKRAVMYGP